MKLHWLFVIVFSVASHGLIGEIKNGYGSEIENIRASLKGLNNLLVSDTALSVFQKVEIRDKILMLMEYVVYFELTEELLIQFKMIAPDLFNELDTIKNSSGFSVTVYVKFVPEKEMQKGAAGTTNLAYYKNDKNVYHSIYGPHTVSIKIASVKKSLLLLAHEFGHVKYQVPNLATYAEYYAKHYQSNGFVASYIGHNADDPSGQKANEFENLFRNKYVALMRTTSAKLENPTSLLVNIRRAIKREKDVL